MDMESTSSSKKRKDPLPAVHGPEYQKKKKKLSVLKRMIDAVAADPTASSLLIASFTSEGQRIFVGHMAARILPNLPQDDVALLLPQHESDIYSSLLQACSNAEQLPPPLKSILDSLKTARKERKSARKSLIQALMYTGSGKTQQVLRMENTDVLRVVSLQKPYPPLKHWIYDSPQIAEKWEKKLQQDPQPDPRLCRRPMHLLDPSQLKFDILPHQSYVLRTPEPDNRLVGIVLRDFCPADDLLDALHDIIQLSVGARKSIRLEDPGNLVQIGYSAGARKRSG